MYVNQNESVKQLRAWAKQNGYIMRKCNVLLNGSKCYKLYNKTNNKAVSSYFTLHDVTMVNNHSSMGFDGLVIGNDFN